MSEQLPRVTNEYLRYYYPDSTHDIALLRSCGIEFESLTTLNANSLKYSVPQIHRQLLEGKIVKKSSLEVLQTTLHMADLNNRLYPGTLPLKFKEQPHYYTNTIKDFKNIDNLKDSISNKNHTAYITLIRMVLNSCKESFESRFDNLIYDMEYLEQNNLSRETYHHIKYAAKTVGRLSLISGALINYLEIEN